MQNKKSKFSSYSFLAFFCSVLVFTSNITGYATNPVTQLEEQTSALDSQLSNLRNELTSLTKDIEALTQQETELAQAARKTTLDLAAAKLSRNSQYKQMKKRIKYIYENGGSSFLELICSAENMADFLNSTEFVAIVTEYDRKMLLELQAVQAKIEQEELNLKEKQTQLTAMQSELESKRKTLSEKVSSAESSLALSQDQLAAARAAMIPSTNTDSPPPGGGGSGAGSSGGDGGTIQKPPLTSSISELALFAGILECEAGTTNYDALLAVATVIMNRVESPNYAEGISGVIYQRGQFPPAYSGKLDKILARGPGALCYTVAQDALNGARLAQVSHCYSFQMLGVRPGIVVGDNVFY